MTTRITLDELDGEQHHPGRFGWIMVVSPDRPDDGGETVWQQESNISSGDPNVRSTPMRLLTIVSSDPDAVRRRLEDFGYDGTGFVDDGGV